jgi:hypothetical protein
MVPKQKQAKTTRQLGKKVPRSTGIAWVIPVISTGRNFRLFK